MKKIEIWKTFFSLSLFPKGKPFISCHFVFEFLKKKCVCVRVSARNTLKIFAEGLKRVGNAWNNNVKYVLHHVTLIIFIT